MVDIVDATSVTEQELGGSILRHRGPGEVKNMMELSGKLKHLFVSRQWVFLVLVMVIISIFTGAVNPRFLTIRNLTNLLSQLR